MNDHIIVGSITMPYSLSNPERLLWLEDWIANSSPTLICQRKVELIFLSEEDIQLSMKAVSKRNRWVMVSGNEYLSPDGAIVKFFYDIDAEKLLNEYTQ
jgi:hypothetical protein